MTGTWYCAVTTTAKAKRTLEATEKIPKAIAVRVKYCDQYLYILKLTYLLYVLGKHSKSLPYKRYLFKNSQKMGCCGSLCGCLGYGNSDLNNGIDSGASVCSAERKRTGMRESFKDILKSFKEPRNSRKGYDKCPDQESVELIQPATETNDIFVI
jgi:hypothetical protein